MTKDMLIFTQTLLLFFTLLKPKPINRDTGTENTGTKLIFLDCYSKSY